MGVLGFRTVAPKTPQGTPLEKYGAPNPRAIVNCITFNVKDDPPLRFSHVFNLQRLLSSQPYTRFLLVFRLSKALGLPRFSLFGVSVSK
jgi:hypothetical protein